MIIFEEKHDEKQSEKAISTVVAPTSNDSTKLSKQEKEKGCELVIRYGETLKRCPVKWDDKEIYQLSHPNNKPDGIGKPKDKDDSIPKID